MRKYTLKSVIALALTAMIGDASAKPPAPGVFCQKYPQVQECTGKLPSCTFCHVAPPQRNAFGMAIEMNLAQGMPRPLSDTDFAAALPAALAAAEAVDSDGDGATNLAEIQQGTLPADPNSKPGAGGCEGGENPQYAVCKYDLRHAYKKALLDFCGGSPTYAQVKMFADLPSDDMRRVFLDSEIDRCTQTEFWRGKNGALWKVAHPKIRPVGSLKGGDEDKGGIPLADYYDDYSMFAYSQTDDHDAREILTADFYVRRDVNPTRYTKVTTLSTQVVDQAHRAGNMTTTWSLAYFVMFTAVPRNAAAQMYRAYLGLDIAKQEGLFSVANEPQDYDAKGVTAQACAACHATLDPLTYPFRNYNGLTGALAARYVPMRLETLFPNEAPRITQTPEKGVIFGQTVNNLREWANVGANSEAFAVSTTRDYWKLLIGHAPKPEENVEFVATWQRFKTMNQYRVQKLLHDIVQTEAYGAP